MVVLWVQVGLTQLSAMTVDRAGDSEALDMLYGLIRDGYASMRGRDQRQWHMALGEKKFPPHTRGGKGCGWRGGDRVRG